MCVYIYIISLAPNFINMKYISTPPLHDKSFAKHLPTLYRVRFILLILLTQLTVFLNQNNNIEIQLKSSYLTPSLQ